MSELLGVSIKKTGEKGEIMMTIRDIHPDAYNAENMYGFPPEEGENPMDNAGFILALLLEGSDSYRGQIYDFIKEYERARHLSEKGNLADFDENKKYHSISGDIEIIKDDQIIESILESSEIVESDANDFWEEWDGEDYEDEELPYVKVKVAFKNEEWSEKFDGNEFDTAFSINMDY